jgi:diguanylate cyclase (GGDEF)-like protein
LFIRELINKDVKAKNESKRVMVALRILYIIVFLAFAIDTILAGKEVVTTFPYRVVGLFAVNIILFVFTYYSKTRTSLSLFILFLFSWIFAMIPCFGWRAGMQNYFIIILMLCFFATYAKSVYKFLYAGFILLVRIITIGVFSGVASATNISQTSDKLLKITNISAVFSSIIFISYLFSQKETEAENKLMKYNDQLQKEANTDQLTGLFNRRKAIEFLETVKETKADMNISVAMGDIDFFKKVNDTYGHDAGDEVLKFVANKMREECGDTSVISRWGGEEFLIIIPDCNGDHAFVTMEKLRNKIRKSSIKVGDEEINVTMTFGITEYGSNSDIDTLIKEADEKLYYGKQNGRNQVVF